jgi:hypothetical protein
VLEKQPAVQRPPRYSDEQGRQTKKRWPQHMTRRWHFVSLWPVSMELDENTSKMTLRLWLKRKLDGTVSEPAHAATTEPHWMITKPHRLWPSIALTNVPQRYCKLLVLFAVNKLKTTPVKSVAKESHPVNCGAPRHRRHDPHWPMTPQLRTQALASLRLPQSAQLCTRSTVDRCTRRLSISSVCVCAD